MRLVYELPPKSYAPVHIRATRVERKLDYFATLCSHFADGAVLMRPIKGVYMQVNHQHLRPVYGQVVLQEPPPKPTPTTPVPSAQPPAERPPELEPEEAPVRGFSFGL